MFLNYGELVELTGRERPKAQTRALKQLLTLEELRALPSVGQVVYYHSGDAGIYFLWEMAVLLYIGKAVDVPYRVYRQHSQTKNFTHATWLQIEEEHRRRRLEREYVLHYCPPLNRTRLG